MAESTTNEVEMAEAPEIKLEPCSASTTESEPETLFLPLANQDTNVVVTQPETTIPLWKHSPGTDRKQKVIINEEAAEHAHRYFMAIAKILRDFSHLSSSESRLEDIKGIYARRRRCKARIGFLGGTGTGKSSLINALLMERVLPRSEEAASTAVPVEVSYNDSENPEALYRAYIEGISKVEFTEELEGLFADKLAWDQGDGLEAGEVDFEMHQRMNTTFSKIKCLFPKLQTLDDLKKTSAEKLLSHEEVNRILDVKTNIRSANLQHFSDEIKRYIEANSQGKEGSQKISVWPLVKLVRIYTKADILKPGIILVDLPGNLDTSAARVAVTEEHKKKLTLSVVVAPAVRASSDKGAHELLNSTERRKMQLDGQYKSGSLFFVVTKKDQLEEYENYIKDHRNMDQSTVDALAIMQDIDHQIVNLTRESNEKLKPHNKDKKDLEKCQMTHAKLAPQVEKILNELSPSGLKRKRVEDCQDSDFPNATVQQKEKIQNLRKLHTIMAEKFAAVSNGGNDLFRIQASISKLTYKKLITECSVKAACIRNRDGVHRADIRAEFDAGRAMMGKESSGKELSIFSVSSNVFTRLNNKNGRDYGLQRGFFRKSDTGIPALRDGLLATTWEMRESFARSFNEDAASSLTRMKLWVSNKSVDFKMSHYEREDVESRIGMIVDELETKFSKLHSETSKEVKQLIQTGIFAKLQGFNKTAGQQAKGIVTDWTLVPWNTHRATNKRHGVWQSGPDVYNWNDELAGNYLDLLVKSWTQTIHQKITELEKSYQQKVEIVINEFAERLLDPANNFDPAINEAIHLLKENVLRLGTILKNSGADVFAGVIEASKNAHRLVEPEVLSSWEDVYEMCGAEKGTGVWKRIRQAHQDHVKTKGGAPMYRRCGLAIKAELTAAFDELPDAFEENYQAAADLVKEDLRIMLERYTLDPSSSADNLDQSVEADKIRLQEAFAPVFAELEKAWGIEPIPEVVEDDDVPPEEDLAVEESDAGSLDLDSLLS
ncbi:hypothetical protein VTL71DRAFT_6420 [Oculimacula yallundae]|uniref:Nuclear GTPase SLIP-GC n=1 Tax=Oculimacula yallundae TaxID=86028 RepID=A0ABR4BWW7_9HELO